jgi:hypothetical protein
LVGLNIEDVNLSKQTVFHLALESNKFDFLHRVLKITETNTKTHQNKIIKKIQTLITYAQDDEGMTLLMRSLIMKQVDFACALLNWYFFFHFICLFIYCIYCIYLFIYLLFFYFIYLFYEGVFLILILITSIG